MGATGVHERQPERSSWWRRALAWTFPRPYSKGTKVWTFITLAYVVSVAVCAVAEVNWLITFDEEANGAPIPIATMLWTAPTGWLALVALFTLEGEGDAAGAGGNSGLILVWSAMALLGWLQAWVIWRLGIAVDRWSRSKREAAPVVEPVSS